MCTTVEVRRRESKGHIEKSWSSYPDPTRWILVRPITRWPRFTSGISTRTSPRPCSLRSSRPRVPFSPFAFVATWWPDVRSDMRTSTFSNPPTVSIFCQDDHVSSWNLPDTCIIHHIARSARLCFLLAPFICFSKNKFFFSSNRTFSQIVSFLPILRFLFIDFSVTNGVLQ